MYLHDSPIGDFIPFSSHVSREALKTTGGDYLLSWELGGLPFVGRSEAELRHRHATFNRLLQALRAPDSVNVAFWTHEIRRHCRPWRGALPPAGFNREVGERYYRQLASQRSLCNRLYLTLIYRPQAGNGHLLGHATDIAGLRAEQESALAKLLELAGNVEAVLHDYTPRRLGLYEGGKGQVFSETLELFGWLLNRVDEPVPVLPAPIGNYLPVSRHLFSPDSGDFVITTPTGSHHFGAILNIGEYAEATFPGILDGLKYLDFEYVLTQSFSPVGRQDALRILERTKGRMISAGDRAVSQIVELDQAMDQLASGHFVLGEYHFTASIHAETQAALARNLAAARAELANAGFVSVKEDLAVAASFHSQLPGNWRYRTRPANLSSLNFLGLSPLHNFACGKPRRNPWGECVATLRGGSGQPYHFNFHATDPAEDSFGEKAIGNTLVIGKSGTGKTALINFLLSQTQKYDPPPTIFFFDKDRGAEIFVRACGGNYLALENGRPSGFNPFQCDYSEANLQFLAGLVKLLAGKAAYSAREEEDIHRALANLLDSPRHLRSMDNLRKSLPNTGDDGVHARLRRWTAGHALGWVFDNPADAIDLERANIIGFDYTGIIDNPEVRVPVIHYLLHRLEALIDGRRLIYVMDEFWKILDGDSGLKEFARNKQKTIRKQNGLGIFATQSPEDALASDISAALVEQAATLILLPNPSADRADYMQGLKLSEAEYQVVAGLDERSRCFLVKQGHGSSLCRLDLHGMEDILAVISASTDNVRVLHQVLAEVAMREGVDPDALAPETWLPLFQQRRKGMRQVVGAEDAVAAQGEVSWA